MVKKRNATFSLRWLALVGVILGTLVVAAGPKAQAQNQSGAWEAAALLPQEQTPKTPSDLAAAGIVVPGSPVSASAPEKPTAEATAPQPQGPISSSGVVGVGAPTEHDSAQTSDDPAAAGVVQ
jgi:hypothetical protein